MKSIRNSLFSKTFDSTKMKDYSLPVQIDFPVFTKTTKVGNSACPGTKLLA